MANLQVGSKGEAVTRLQESLAALGLSPGPIDGIFGTLTEQAVKEFQSRVGLRVDGIAGPKTMEALANALKTVNSGRPIPQFPELDPNMVAQLFGKAQSIFRGSGSGSATAGGGIIRGSRLPKVSQKFKQDKRGGSVLTTGVLTTGALAPGSPGRTIVTVLAVAAAGFIGWKLLKRSGVLSGPPAFESFENIDSLEV